MHKRKGLKPEQKKGTEMTTRIRMVTMPEWSKKFDKINDFVYRRCRAEGYTKAESELMANARTIELLSACRIDRRG